MKEFVAERNEECHDSDPKESELSYNVKNYDIEAPKGMRLSQSQRIFKYVLDKVKTLKDKMV